MPQAVESLDLRQPNNEQKEAIEHRGGMLLSAGAGSGKTFVLVEHIHYLFVEQLNALKGLDPESIKIELKKYFARIVIMTFTKKAAGELSIRVKKRFQLSFERSRAGVEPIEPHFWAMADDVIGQIYIGTIHGFCFQLISSGAISGFQHELKMLNEVELKEKVKMLFEHWFELYEKELEENLRDFILFNKSSFLKTLTSIFSDPDLRLRWSNFSCSGSIDLDSSLANLLSLNLDDWRDNFVITEEMLTCDSKKKPKWLEFLESFRESVRLDNPWEFLLSAQQLFSGVGRTPPVRQDKVIGGVYDFFQNIKLLKSFIKKYFDDLSFCYNNQQDLMAWSQMIKKIYGHIEDHYLTYEGITFSDLEYYVYLNLIQGKASQTIYQDYSYFIIDEFQDTSQIQFRIVKEIIKGDMKKVFSVGDVKQAIYGFRGGELGVFREASRDTYKNLSLLYNYRSSGQVIDFNNTFFSFLLPLGIDYQGQSDYSVKMEAQSIPKEKENTGRVIVHKVSITGELPPDKKTLSSAEINYIEAKEIFSYLKNNNSTSHCVLYSKLRPSYYLLKQLIDHQMSFTFQVKVPFSEDPLIALFSIFAHYHAFNDKSRDDLLEKAVYQLGSLRSLLDLPEVTDNKLKDIFLASSTWHQSLGALEAFKKFLWKMEVSTSNAYEVWPLIQTIAELGENRCHLIAEYIKPMTNESYSIDLQQGDTPEGIIVMTVHASKGLEFGNVILGGIHTNGDRKSSLDSFGKEPYSFKWYPKSLKRTSIRTPQYIYEYEEAKLKDFDEYKRLLYVALTRAVDSLVWFDLSLNDKELFYAKNSWICALRKWIESDSTNEAKSKVLKDSIMIDRDLGSLDLEHERLDLRPAMIHLDTLGVVDKGCDLDSATSLILSSELSVTRLTLLNQCPRKFYLKNLLKLDVASLNISDEKNEQRVDSIEHVAKKEPSLSNSERGTLIHESLSSAIERNMVLKLAITNEKALDKRGLDGMEWALENLRDYQSQGYQLISEKPVKFSLFGQMISGTPDLVLRHVEKKHLEVWDFKTGAMSEEKNRTYWLQLYCYAYALLASSDVMEVADLKIVYTDEKKIVHNRTNYSDTRDILFELWQKLDNLDQVNLNHCSQCEYSETCRSP